MKSSSHPIRRAVLLLICGLGLVSCKENQALQKQLDEANAKFQAVSQESIDLEIKLASSRRLIPAYAGVGVAGANHYATQLATELANSEGQLAQAQASITAAEAELEAARKELQLVKSKDPR
ncbi:MAG: hypothetical protein V4662_04615 [Verrucomicrobiota bacterium]